MSENPEEVSRFHQLNIYTLTVGWII